MPNNGSTIYVGADPELFLRNKKTGRFNSAFGIVPGTKEKPFSVPFGAVQVDGVAAEFNINPAASGGDFHAYCTKVIQSLAAFAPDHELVTQPVAVFDEDVWGKIPEESKALGCNPDFNAWTGQVNDPPDDQGKRMRTASGHIHIGWTEGESGTSHFEDCMFVAKQLDYTIGLFTLLWDTDARRRSLYGKAGAFRPKPYGVEYRTPSNMWLKFPTLMPWIWNQAFSTVSHLRSGNSTIMADKHGDLARQVIDNNNLEFIKTELRTLFEKDMADFTSWPVWNKVKAA